MPYYMKADKHKTLWRIIKENSLTMTNLYERVELTESRLFDGSILCSGSLEDYGKDIFDIKGILLNENDSISVINKLRLKFPYRSSTLESWIEVDKGADAETS